MVDEKLKPLHSWAMLLGLSVIWGSSFILIKKGLTVYTPMQVGALRVSISALCFFPVLIVRRSKFQWDKFKFYLIVALAGSGIPAFLYPFAQTHIDSAVAGILNALTPLFTLIIGVIVFRKAFKTNYLFGILVGFMGVLILSLKDLQLHGISGIVFYVFIIIATMCYATSVNTVDTFLKKVDSITLSASTFVLLGPITISYLASTDLIYRFKEVEGGSMAMFYVFILAFFGTFLSTMVFFYVVHKTSALYGSLVAYLIPIVALCWGFYFGEAIGWSEMAGMACILLGIYLSKNY
jgi:drug/metabolite transporter (DMT)-like permease